MSEAAISRRNGPEGRSELGLIVSPRRVPAVAVAPLQQAADLLQRANELLREAEAQAEAMREAGRAEGLAEGRRLAAAELSQTLLLAQLEAKSLVADSESRIVRLACELVRRIVPGLALETRVCELASEAIRAVQAERFLTVRVHPDAVASVREQLGVLAQSQPTVDRVQVLADASLDRLGCVAESELGAVRAGFFEQLARLESGLQQGLGEAPP